MSRQFQLVALLIAAVFLLTGVVANGARQHSKRFAIYTAATDICRYTEGPYAGKVSGSGAPRSAYPVPAGGRCTDGHCSFGIAIARIECGECVPSAMGATTTDRAMHEKRAAKHHATHRALHHAERTSMPVAARKATPHATSAGASSTTEATSVPGVRPPEIQSGLAAFRKPPPMQVGSFYPIVFVAGIWNTVQIVGEDFGSIGCPRNGGFRRRLGN
jgi:hypothetical protein